MKLRINEKEVSNKTRYNRRKCRLLSDEEYDYWFDVGLEAFNRGDKCVPAWNKELMDYLRRNPANIGSAESKKHSQMDIAWTDGWTFGNLSDDSWKFESLREKQAFNIIPYDLVSTLVILRDWVDVGDAYINEEHKNLVDIADSLFNGGIDVEDMFPKYQSLYNNAILLNIV